MFGTDGRIECHANDHNGQPIMPSTTELTTRQKFENLKKRARRITFDDRIESGKHRFEKMGVDPEDVERMAKLADLEPHDLYFLASGGTIGVKPILPASPSDTSAKSESDLRERLIRLEEMVSRIGRLAARSNEIGDEGVVTHLRRIADHFDPPNLEVVGTSYIAQRLGVTPKWVGDLVRKGEIPSSCICPKSGNGNYWRFWKMRIDKWIEER